MAAVDTEQPLPDAGLVAFAADLAVSAERRFQPVDRLVPVALPLVQDAEVFRCGGSRPRVGMLGGGLGQTDRVTVGQAPAITGDGRYLYAIDPGAQKLVSWAVGQNGQLVGAGDSGGLPATAAGLAAS